jgi:hypothetical protein
VIACAICYFLGYHSGVRHVPLKNQLEGDLLIALRTYQASQATNWTKVQSTLATQVLALTRHYEQVYGAPTGTNAFARHFPEAKAMADQIERQMVPLGSVLTNVPHAAGAKVTVRQ